MNNNFYNVQQISSEIYTQEYFPTEQNNYYLNNIISNDINISNPTENNLVENLEEYTGIEEVPIKNYNYNYLQTNRQNSNQFYHFNNKLGRRHNSNINNIPDFSNLISPFQNSNLNQVNSGNIFNSNKTQFIQNNDNLYNFGNVQNKINIRQGNQPIKKTQSKYSSKSENKYNYLNTNPKFGFSVFTEKNIPKLGNTSNFSLKNIFNDSSAKLDSNIVNLNNSFNGNYNTYKPPVSQSYISGIGNSNNIINIKGRGNRFLNKSVSNYGFNTINSTNLQGSLLSSNIINDNNLSYKNNFNESYTNNNIFSNFDLMDQINTQQNNPLKKTISSSFKSNYQNIFNDNMSNNYNQSNYENQRLTVAYRNIKNSQRYIQPNKPEFQNRFKSFNQTLQNVQIPYNQPKIAKVTKISSIHTIIPNNYDLNAININNIGHKNNISQTNQLSINKINNTEIIQANNTKIIPQKNQTNNTKNIQNQIRISKNEDIQILSNQSEQINKPNQTEQKKIFNSKNKNDGKILDKVNIIKKIKLSKNKEEENEIGNLIEKPDIKERINKPTQSAPTKTLLSKTNNELVNKNKADTNKTGTDSNLNSQSEKKNENQDNKEQNNNRESEKKTFEKNKNNISKQKSNNGIDIRYNDFDGSGYIRNYGGVTRPGKDLLGRIKINQDAIVILTNINKIRDFNILGVLDGHGPDGHYVSEFISKSIPSKLSNHPEIKNLKEPEEIYRQFKKNNCKIITQAFLDADKELENVLFDTSRSGTTCCLIIHIGTHIICANTGDSRALVVFDDSPEENSNSLDYLKAVPLSIDYKPELPEEANRIIKSGGVIEQMTDEFGKGVGPMRVWAKDEDYPGLAMSRSIGDLKGKTVGVIPDPGIFEYDLNKTSKFVIVCSDGVWECLNNESVKDMGKKFYSENNASAFCHLLLSKSFELWEKNENFIDDISAVVAFF